MSIAAERHLVRSVRLVEAKLTKFSIACCAASLILLGANAPARAQGNAAHGEVRVIEPIITEESLPEDAGECNLRTTASYHVGVLETLTDLPRAQLFCGFSRRWGGEVDVPMERSGGRYGPRESGASVKYKLREETSRIPALVLGLEATFPVHGRDPDEQGNGVEVQPFLAVLKQVRGFTLQGNIGVGILRNGSSKREYRAAYNGAVVIPLRSTRFTLVGEVNAASAQSGATLATLFSPGLHYGLGRDCYIAFAAPLGRRHGATSIGAVFQFQMRVRKGQASD